MISFILALVILIAGYFTYGLFVSKVFGVEQERITPVHTKADGVDYVALPTWKIFLIQFLNIAGLGPIFGAIMGVMFGPAAFLWIVFGTIFAGAVHDYLSGMLSLRQGGASLPEIVGGQLGGKVKNLMRVFALLLMILVGAVFVYNPADLLAMLTPEHFDRLFWIVVIFIYYMAATLLPIDKLIGKLYPLFGIALLFMAVGIMAMLFFHHDAVPEVWHQFYNHKPNPEANPIFPMMFVSIACGAISGFHATQSPMMARCLKNEKYGRPIFYGAMVTEGVVALIWAAAAVAFTGGYGELQEFLGNGSPAILVDDISKRWLGQFGGILAILGVVAAPITSGDTALRSARLIAADFMGLDQKKIVKRLLVSVPIFIICFIIMLLPYDALWRYFAWCNQVLSVFTLWTLTVWLARNNKLYAVTLLPAMFMTCVTVTYILYAPEGLGLLTLPLLGYTPSYELSIGVGMVVTVLFTSMFVKYVKTLPRVVVN
ncbi:MAG: carbon starvation protein A [Prevotella sp.]|nr:carbon starvation protein A [Bacteroides sp.]MCM1366102.1 carbon starvation protein A [Prevotella sp.]MCM1436587.1 carbon starvation protein A [Prevotella sp.]